MIVESNVAQVLLQNPFSTASVKNGPNADAALSPI
jgi:hypothetical protein